MKFDEVISRSVWKTNQLVTEVEIDQNYTILLH